MRSFYFLCLAIFLALALCVIANAHEERRVATYQIAGGTVLVSVTDYVLMRNEYLQVVSDRDILVRELSISAAENGKLRSMLRLVFSATTIERLRELIKLLDG